MAKKKKAVKAAEPKDGKSAAPATALKAKKASKPGKTKAAKPKKAKAAKPKKKKPAKAKPSKKKAEAPAAEESEQLVSSEVMYQGPLFRVVHDKLIEPGGKHSERDVIRHNGSVVILAIDTTRSRKDPWIVIERQYRHAARRFLWELPAGKLEPGEDALAGARRELAEETGYAAKKWRPLAEYFASPGFLGESMQIFVAEGLVAGDAHPEADEEIDFRLVKLSELLKMIEKGAIQDGKTLTGVLIYTRLTARKRKK
jgi:ADP-ribose pyrophosphatase